MINPPWFPERRVPLNPDIDDLLEGIDEEPILERYADEISDPEPEVPA